MEKFIGRKSEIETAKRLLQQEGSRILVINGRRRIGKSTLASKIAEGYKFFNFSGLAPEESADQLSNFLKQLSQQTGNSYEDCADWDDVLFAFSKEISETEKTVVLLDEISWMAHGDPNFIGKLKNWWDLHISHKNVLLIFCGSVSTWIEKNILNSTAFYGRISAIIRLQQLSISDSVALLKERGFRYPAFEFFKVLAVTGGVPWYLEQLNPQISANKNIENLCFNPSGILNFEFEKIFNDVFSRYGDIYRKILQELSNGMRTLSQIRTAVNYPNGGRLSLLMENLIISGFVSKHSLWSFKSKKLSNISLYRISDPYIRFYLKYIQKNQQASLPAGFDSMIGIQMESLLLQNNQAIFDLLKVEEPLIDGPYIQKPIAEKKGCQIDYLIQTKNNMLYVCEIKFRKTVVGTEVIDEVKEKINRLVIPRGMAVVPVLFHIGDLSSEIYESNYFYKIVDMNELLDSSDRAS